nr:hypothetical protein [Tanacetum cinerariifolium]
MKGSGQTLERRKEALFDEFKCFHANGNELIQDYFVCFYKLVNDMKVTQLDIPTHQLNTKFANNLPSYWGKYVTHAKNNINMSTVMYVELFTHLRTYKEHALKSLKKKEQSFAVVDPLAYLAKTTLTHSTTSHVTVPTPQSSGDSHNDAMLATMNQIANLLSVQRRAPGNTRTKGIQTTGLGVNYSGKKWYHDKALLMQAKEKGVVLDAEAEAFLADVECIAPYDQPLALMTTNLFEANHEDAYHFDVDEGPHASAAFMANLSSIDGTNGSSLSNINEEEHLNSDVDSVLDDNMIMYDEYQNDSRVEAVPFVVSADEANKQSMIAFLQCMHTEIAGYVRVNDEHKLVNTTLTVDLERCKIEMQAFKHNKVKHDLDMAIVERNKRNAELEEENVMLKSTLKSKVVSVENLQQKSKQVLTKKKTLKDKYLEEIVVLTNANKVATNVLKGLGYSNARYGKQARIAQPALYDGHVLLNPNHPPTRVHDSEESLVHVEVCKIKIAEQPGHALPINYAKLNALYNQFVPQNEFIANDICSIALAYELVVPPSSDSSHCMLEELGTTCDREHSKVLKLEAEILKKQQALETELTQLKDTVTSLKIQNDGYKVTNANLNRCYEELLSKANTHLRTTSLEKIAAQKAEIATLNAKTVGNKTSETIKPANPKETPKPSPRFTKKPVALLLKKPTVTVPLFTRIKSATGASKPASKSNAWIYRKLPAKSTRKGEKVEEHIRNLNKNNRVDSHVKRSVSVKNLNAVCGACHECLISSNHDNCLVYSMKSVNCKQPKAKNTMRTTKKVWRPKGWKAGSKGIPAMFE